MASSAPMKIPPQAVGIDSHPRFNRPKGYPPEPTEPVAKTPNHKTRRSFINMALAGAGFRQIVRTCKNDGATEEIVMETFREELIRGGALNRVKEAA